MHNLSMVQALWIWSELVAAYYGKNGYGGDTAEIYEYRLLPNAPAFDSDADGEFFAERRAELHKQAAESLRALVLHFEETHDCEVHVPFGSTSARASAVLSEMTFEHRIHLRVKHKPREKRESTTEP